MVQLEGAGSLSRAIIPQSPGVLQDGGKATPRIPVFFERSSSSENDSRP